MENKDQIKELFQQQLSNHQEAVRPEIWASVSSAIATPVLVTTGISILSKTFIGLGIAASVLVSAYLLYSSDDKAVKVPAQENKKAKEVPSIPNNNNNTLVPIETKKNAIPLIVLENNDLLGVEEVVYEMNAPKIIPFESVQLSKVLLPNTDPLQDLGENVSNDPVETNNDVIVMPHVENTHESSPLPAEKNQELEIVLTNVFTPNGDGTNDFLFIQSEGLQDFSVVILNQTNKIIYQSTDPKFNWDGKLINGDDAPTGQYVYFITAKSDSGDLINKYSTLFIQR